VNDVLLLVDVVNDFQHDDGEALLRTFRARHEGLVAALDHARATQTTTGDGGTAMRRSSSATRSSTVPPAI